MQHWRQWLYPASNIPNSTLKPNTDANTGNITDTVTDTGLHHQSHRPILSGNVTDTVTDTGLHHRSYRPILSGNVTDAVTDTGLHHRSHRSILSAASISDADTGLVPNHTWKHCPSRS